MSDNDERVAARETEIALLQSKMLSRNFFVMFRQVVEPRKFRESLPEHLRWLVKLERQGLILASGPAFQQNDTPTTGMTVFRVATFQDAEKLAASDPVCIAGAAEFHLVRWCVGAGRVSLSIDLSDQSCRFD